MNQLVEPNIFAAAGIIIFVILISIIYLFNRKLIKKKGEDYDNLESMETTDELTQLVKREYFNTLLESELARVIRYDKNLSCAIIEIDRFNKIKERYGPQLSDEVLQDTAENIADELRVNDILARDDDRFICLLPETDIKSALYVSKRLRSLVEGETFDSEKESETIHITVSIGITFCEPSLDKETAIYEIINTADKALNVAKEKGGNRVEYLSTSNP